MTRPALLLLLTSLVTMAAPTGQELCGRLAASQLSKILGKSFSSEPGETQCKYTAPGRAKAIAEALSR